MKEILLEIAAALAVIADGLSGGVRPEYVHEHKARILAQVDKLKTLADTPAAEPQSPAPNVVEIRIPTAAGPVAVQDVPPAPPDPPAAPIPAGADTAEDLATKEEKAKMEEAIKTDEGAEAKDLPPAA